MPTTETGSVGARIAPSTKHQTRGTGRSTRGKISHMPVPNRPIASTVPSSASASTGFQRPSNWRRSTCSAPANSRNDSALPNSACGRSMAPSHCRDRACRPISGTRRSIPSIVSDASSSEISSTPMVFGSRSVRLFTTPNTADTVSSSANSASGVMVCLTTHVTGRPAGRRRNGVRPPPSVRDDPRLGAGGALADAEGGAEISRRHAGPGVRVKQEVELAQRVDNAVGPAARLPGAHRAATLAAQGGHDARQVAILLVHVIAADPVGQRDHASGVTPPLVPATRLMRRRVPRGGRRAKWPGSRRTPSR